MPETVPPTVDQPNWPPTNKLLAMTITTAVTNAVLRGAEALDLLLWIAPDIGSAREIVSIVMGFAVTYWLVKDKPNQPKLVEQLKDAQVRKRIAEGRVSDLEQAGVDKRAKEDAPRAGHDSARK